MAGLSGLSERLPSQGSLGDAIRQGSDKYFAGATHAALPCEANRTGQRQGNLKLRKRAGLPQSAQILQAKKCCCGFRRYSHHRCYSFCDCPLYLHFARRTHQRKGHCHGNCSHSHHHCRCCCGHHQVHCLKFQGEPCITTSTVSPASRVEGILTIHSLMFGDGHLARLVCTCKCCGASPSGRVRGGTVACYEYGLPAWEHQHPVAAGLLSSHSQGVTIRAGSRLPQSSHEAFALLASSEVEKVTKAHLPWRAWRCKEPQLNQLSVSGVYMQPTPVRNLDTKEAS